MKHTLIVFIFLLFSCSEAPEQESDAQLQKQAEKAKLSKNDHALKDYQRQLQRAKDMEKEVLEAAKRQKKAIDDASN